jgi:hypothetical protein
MRLTSSQTRGTIFVWAAHENRRAAVALWERNANVEKTALWIGSNTTRFNFVRFREYGSINI